MVDTLANRQGGKLVSLCKVRQNLLYIYFKRDSIFLKNKREDGNISTLPQVP